MIIASDDNAVKYVVAPYFKHGPIPVVFCGVNWTCAQYGLPTDHVTGMLEVLPVEQTLRILLASDIQAKKLTVLSENTTSERSNERVLAPLFKDMGLTAQTVLVDNFTQWQAAFVQANRDADLIFLPTNGAIKSWDKTAAQNFVQREIRVPVFTNDDFMMPYAVFGLTKIAGEQGQWAAHTALKILAGASPAHIAIAQNAQTQAHVNKTLAQKIGFTLNAGQVDSLKPYEPETAVKQENTP